jgi:hypothetical protein
MVRHRHYTAHRRKHPLDVLGVVSQLCSVGRGETWRADTEFSSTTHRFVLDFGTHPKTALTLLPLRSRSLPLLLDHSVVAFHRRMLRISTTTPSPMKTSNRLTNRWSQPLAAVKSTFNLMKQFSMFASLAATSGGSALSR